LALEMIFIKLFQAAPMLPIDTLIQKLDQLHETMQTIPGAPGQVATMADEWNNNESYVSTAEKVESAEPIDQPDGYTAAAESTDTIQRREEVDAGVIWQRLLAKVQDQKPSLAALLKKCHFKSIEDGQLAIEVQENAFTYKNVSKQIELLEKICCDLLGQTVALKIIGNVETSAAKNKQKKSAGRLKQKALSHPLVMEVLELFDGKVVDVKTK
jgi:DNA polymerase-3 subunit gamma/tau